MRARGLLTVNFIEKPSLTAVRLACPAGISQWGLHAAGVAFRHLAEPPSSSPGQLDHYKILKNFSVEVEDAVLRVFPGLCHECHCTNERWAARGQKRKSP